MRQIIGHFGTSKGQTNRIDRGTMGANNQGRDGTKAMERHMKVEVKQTENRAK